VAPCLVGGPFDPGYGLYLLEIFLPGVGIGELLCLWKREDCLAEKFGLALGLGLAFDTLILAARTSGVTILGETLRGADLPTIYFILGVGVATLAISWFRKRRLDFLGMPTWTDLAMALLTVALGTMVALYFAKYPIFPQLYSADQADHTSIVQGLISGTTTTLPGGVLYYGVHYQLASALLLVGGEPLVTVQRTMGLLVILSPLMVYVASKRIFASSKAGLLAAAIYVLSGAIWFGSVFDAGLYANFFGVIASLFFLVAFLQVAEGVRSSRCWVVFSFALTMIYFSHYASVTLFPALLILPMVVLVFEGRDVKRYMLLVVVALVPAAAALLTYPNLLSFLFGLVFGGTGGQTLLGHTVLSDALSAFPVMGYMALEVSNDVAFVLLLVLAVISVRHCIISRRSPSLVPCLWFLSLLIVAPFNPRAWRLSYEALVPLTIMAGYGISSLLPKSGQTKRRRMGSGQGRNLTVALVIVLLISPIAVGSWWENGVTGALTDTSTLSQTQQNVYSAMYWLKNNTPAESSYLSVSDWRFVYTYLIFERTTNYTYAPTPAEGLALAKHNGEQFIIVTFFVTLQLPSNPSLYPWLNYQASSNLSLIFNNDDVRIFKIMG